MLAAAGEAKRNAVDVFGGGGNSGLTGVDVL
jgi:hypothetical protein